MFARALLPDRAPAALRARLQEMQRRGFPAGVNTAARGRVRVGYDLDKVMQAGVCLALTRAGKSVAEAVVVARQGVAEIRECYAEVGSRVFGIEEIAPDPAHSLLIQTALGGEALQARFDVLRSEAASQLPMFDVGGVIVDVERIARSLAGAIDDEEGEGLRAQIRAVQHLVLRQRHRDDILNLGVEFS